MTKYKKIYYSPYRKSKIKIVESIESLLDGEKGELYAITKNDKVLLYKKNSIKKV